MPPNRKELQCFLGFAKLYRRFIKNYSLMATPLTRLTSSKLPFSWTPKAEAAFQKLNHQFATAPILTQADPSKPFVVEVDASDVGVGDVLSQSSSKLHPCAYYSRRLSPAERNYDVGNRELLAVKIALEEWRQLLEGAEHPFLVWTDHKNSTYLRNVKRLNARPARWSLFFAHFNFSISCRPCSGNIKPNALLRQFKVDVEPSVCPPILPATCKIGAVTWQIQDVIDWALRTEPDPATGPPGRRFVPRAARSKVLEWVQTAKFSCHPGQGRIALFLKRHFWWDTSDKHVREYVEACTVCARNKTLNKTLGFYSRYPLLT